METNNIREFVDSLNLPFEGEFDDHGNYVVTVDNSNDFSTLFNAISLNTELKQDTDSVATEDGSKFIYSDGVYDIILEADYNNDDYILLISER